MKNKMNSDIGLSDLYDLGKVYYATAKGNLCHLSFNGERKQNISVVSRCREDSRTSATGRGGSMGQMLIVVKILK